MSDKDFKVASKINYTNRLEINEKNRKSWQRNRSYDNL